MLESPLQIAAGGADRAVERSGRRDITQLVAAVQQGKLDAMAAVQEAQGADIDLLKGPSWWPARRDFIAAGIGALLMLLLLLAFGAFRH